MAEFRVFYSWQSDLPNATNRGFIERALGQAVKAIGDDASIELEPVIDRDTAGVPGAPDIADTIFAKIDSSAVFVCDVTITNANQPSRPTPNPNVLIELGYAIKSLGPRRIVMVMNTAFGKPDLLPFDLKMKRVIPYEVEQERAEKSKERQRLSGALENAIRLIIGQMQTTRSTTIPSGNETALKEECEDVLRRGGLQEWRELVGVLAADIPEHLLEWMEKAGQVWEKASPQDRQDARFEAVGICMPTFIPIFVTAEKGREDFWRESVSPLRELALLRNRVGGGLTDVIEIGSHMLYFAGNIGMAIAVRAKHLSLINEWMRLPMPTMDYEQTGEKSWLQVHHAQRLWGQYMPGNRAPFQDILRACDSEYMSRFIRDREKFPTYLSVGNLAQSLYEMARWIEDGDHLKALESSRASELASDLSVWPVWGLMKPNEFQTETWALFGSAEGVRQYVFTDKAIPLEQLWTRWKKWKEICVSALMRGELDAHPPRMLHAEWLSMPGEPPGR